MSKRKKNPEPSPLPPITARASTEEGAPLEAPAIEAPTPATRAASEIPTPGEANAITSDTTLPPPKKTAPLPDDVSRFWSGAGLLFGFWVLAGFFGLILLVLLSQDPVKPLPPLDRPHVEATLGKLLLESKPAVERYARLSAEMQSMLKAERLTDEALRKDLEEALVFAEQVSSPREYWLTPIWVESAATSLRQTLPLLRIEALNDGQALGSRAELPQSQPTWQKVSFGAVQSVSVIWAAGDPLRLRFSLRDAEGLQPTLNIGGDDLELANDAPLPGAAMLLLGEARALTRGQGRYLARVRTQDGGVLVPPLLLLRAIGAEHP